MSSRPSGLNSHAFTALVCPSRTWSTRPLIGERIDDRRKVVTRDVRVRDRLLQRFWEAVQKLAPGRGVVDIRQLLKEGEQPIAVVGGQEGHSGALLN